VTEIYQILRSKTALTETSVRFDPFFIVLTSSFSRSKLSISSISYHFTSLKENVTENILLEISTVMCFVVEVTRFVSKNSPSLKARKRSAVVLVEEKLS
jgi:hypothetical protein